jgi:hypothetical protein
MAAPERFAETSDSSCIAGAVHTWHLCDITAQSGYVRLRGQSGRAADIVREPILTDAVEKVSQMKLWN